MIVCCLKFMQFTSGLARRFDVGIFLVHARGWIFENAKQTLQLTKRNITIIQPAPHVNSPVISINQTVWNQNNNRWIENCKKEKMQITSYASSLWLQAHKRQPEKKSKR